MKKEASTDPLKRTMELVDDYGWNHGWLMNIGDVKPDISINAGGFVAQTWKIIPGTYVVSSYCNGPMVNK